MTIYAGIKALHLLCAVIWVGGMFFAYVVLRPSMAAIEAPLVVTPWRSILVCDVDEVVADTALRVLAPMGLVFDENSPWAAGHDDAADKDF